MKRWTMLLLAMAAPAHASAADQPIALEPTSDWNLNYADDSCRLSRTFGEFAHEVSLSFERFEPGDELMLKVAGQLLDKRPAARSVIRFGPGPHGAVDSLLEAWLPNFTPVLYATSAKLHYPAKMLPTLDASVAGNQPTPRQWYRIDPAVEASITSVELTTKGKPPLRLNLGPMDKPMAAMRKCTDELMTHWGIDVAAHRALTRPVTPSTNPGAWLDWRSYPSDLLAEGRRGLVQVRLSVGPDGVPTQCHIQQSTRPVGFDQAVCRGLMQKARFEPALGGDGQPIASYWRTSVRFDVG